MDDDIKSIKDLEKVTGKMTEDQAFQALKVMQTKLAQNFAAAQKQSLNIEGASILAAQAETANAFANTVLAIHTLDND